MQSLNREVQALKPALFSMKEDLIVMGLDDATKGNIRILAKEANDEYIIICVNNSFYPVDAKIDLSQIGISNLKKAELLFENRSVKIDGKMHLQDTFKPFERHVYRLHAAN
ncbi:MAG: hypothetical protein L3J39_15410 [Verrucomicrobiales bacterium]|nr:hypothetical protein [Verrucomicrobiales bacterium]